MDRASLQWVRADVDESLGQARVSLEAFAEDPANEARMLDCAEALHGVHGVLEMLEVYGVSLLLDELERLARDIHRGRATRRDEACQVLMQGIIQVPEYLDYVSRGHRDTPAVLMPVLNDLRTVRNLPLLSENALFAPDLDAPLPLAQRPVALAGTAFVAYVRKLRPHFQRGLVSLLRGDDPATALRTIESVIAHVQRLLGTSPASRLWWVARAVVDALLSGRLERSTSVKQLLSQLDRQLRRMVREGDACAASSPPPPLLKNLLYYCAQARPGGKRLEVIRSAFGLETLVVKPRGRGEGSGSLFGPDLATVGIVSGGLKELLTRAEDALDTFNRSDTAVVEDLEPLVGLLGQVGDTLGLLGLGVPRRLVTEQQARIATLVAEGEIPGDAQLMEVAASLLEVGRSLDTLADEGVDRSLAPDAQFDEESSAERRSGIEHLQLVTAVVGEAKVDIRAIKEIVTDVVADHEARERLHEIPVRVHQVAGGLRMLSLEPAAELIEAWMVHVQRVLLDADAPPDGEGLDRLAIAIESLDYYLESVVGASADVDLRLAHARACVEVLPDDDPVELPADRTQSTDFSETVVLDARHRALPDGPRQAVSPGVGDARAEDGTEDHAGDAVAGDDVEEIILEAPPEDVEADTAGAYVTLSGESATEAPEASADAEDGDDPSGLLAAAAALAALRSAQDVGEPSPADDESYLHFQPVDDDATASALEDDDQPAPVPDAVERSLQHARDLLERMDDVAGEADADPDGSEPDQTGSARLAPDQFGSNRPLPDSPGMAGGAHDRADESEAAALRAAAAAAASDASTLVAAAGPADRERHDGMAVEHDADILEVFLEEGEEVMAALREAMQSWYQNAPGNHAVTEVRRGFHTLKGSGRMVGAVDVGELSWAVENLLNRVIDGVVPASDAVLALVEEAVDALPALFRALGGGAVAGVDVQDLGRRAEELAESTASGVGEVGQSRAAASEAADAASGAEILDFPLRPETPEAEARTAEAGMARGIEAAFSAETHELLESVGRRLDAGDTTAEPYLRDVRSLSDSFASAGFLPASTLFRSLAQLIDHHHGAGGALDLAAQALVRAATRLVLPRLEAGDLATLPAGPFRALTANLDAEVARLRNLTRPDLTGEGVLAERAELRDTFLEEAGEILDLYDSVVERWRDAGPSRPLLDDLLRGLHSLKGGARMAGIGPVGDLSHTLETAAVYAADGRLPMDDELFGVVEAAQDALADMLDCVVAHQSLVVPDGLQARIETLVARADGGSIAPLSQIDDEAERDAALEALTSEPFSAERGERISVDADLLDSLTGFAGEISISQSRIEQQVGAFRGNIDELEHTVSRLRDQLRRLEVETESQIVYRREREGARGPGEGFDPLEFDRFTRMQEIARGIAESVGDLSNIRDMLNGLTRDSEGILIQQARTNTDLQHGLTRTRMLPVAQVVPRLRRVVRQTARELGKEVRLNVTGDDIRVDRTILSRMSPVFEHLLRNAVDHGIEEPTLRAANGKSPEGTLDLVVEREGAEVRLTLTDDGGGVPVATVRERAIARGLLSENADDDAALQAIFEPALSTRESVTQISGRGVGLDVVQNTVKQLGGTVRVSSKPGIGARFSLRLPLTLAINQALMVRVGTEELGLPLANVDAVVRLPVADAQRLESEQGATFEHTGLRYPFVYLGAALGIAEASWQEERYPVVLMRAGDDRVAVRVDELRGRHEVVVKSVGPLLSAIRWITGATIMGDGRVVLILDAPTLARMAAAGTRVRPQRVAAAQTAEASTGPTVMVVDDSITVRKVTGRFLARNGMNVLTAKDGVEALTLLQDVVPDVMLLDIEMPRMDGFELATTIRNDARLSALPIIMITSRTGAKHNERAAQIGVDRYLGKPYHEGELLDNINLLLKQDAKP